MTEVPRIRPGDTIRVDYAGSQPFSGIVIARRGGDRPGATFTIRSIVAGVGVEQIFPLYSPLLRKVEIVKRAKVRRAKLLFLRQRIGRQAKLAREKKVSIVFERTVPKEAEEALRVEEERAKELAAAHRVEEEEAAKEAEQVEAKEEAG